MSFTTYLKYINHLKKLWRKLSNLLLQKIFPLFSTLYMFKEKGFKSFNNILVFFRSHYNILALGLKIMDEN